MTDEEARRDALIDHLEAVRARWRRLIDDVGPDRLEEPGPMGDWTFKDLAAHLTAWRRRSVDRLEAAARGEPQPPNAWAADLEGEDEDDPINAWIHDRTKDRAANELLAESDAVYDDLIAAVRALPIDAVTDPNRFPWVGGPLAEAQFGGHLDEHEPSVRAWLAR
jgi:hypothetical protein